MSININETLGALPEDLRHMLIEWNKTEVQYRSDASIHQLFEEQVKNSPSSIALVFENQQLTYKALNERANQVAHTLLSRYELMHQTQLPADTLIAVCFENSLEVLIGILGILKAGAAYVPLDPSYPLERIRFLLEDTAAPLLVTQKNLLKRLPIFNGQALYLDENKLEIDKADKSNPNIFSKSNHLAYVIYTSGTTGTPKGVMVEHQGLCNLAKIGESIFGIHKASRVLQISSVGFDVAVEEWVITLTQGATLFLVAAKEKLIGQGFVDICHYYQISFATLSPSLLETIPSTVMIPSLKTLVVGGECSNEFLLNSWHQKVRLINAYGPTEAVVDTTTFNYDGRYPASVIGKPLPNKKVYILDLNLHPCPIGITGELFIGGVGIARGYLNKPELSKEKFIINPFVSDYEKQQGRNTILYRTGDLACWLADGNINFIGRIDNQVKIRGFRIELGEIETALRQHDKIQEAVVIIREAQGNQQLIAYYIPKRDGFENEHNNFSNSHFGRNFILYVNRDSLMLSLTCRL